ncbi:MULTISPECIES: ABC transporter permease subunit [unclassified Exiguobacterium]|uniref:ABC transporter permease subunit n=1 Tax=unclassified Exiguobacterium TaxID=2644629 RepID=UPI000513B632|nr:MULTISPECIES: ABC transporter permease subunit [unclassified Exiguobacterium]KGI85331.1 membrane protein [Exiguobacterium mexicanum]
MVLISALFKQNRSWILGYSLGTSLYLFFLAAVFPSIQETGLIEGKLDSLPPELLEVFKIDPNLAMDNVINLLAGNYYGLIFYVLAILFALTFASRLMAKPVDSGEVMLYLAAPISRAGYVTASMVLLVIASGILVGLNGLSLMLANVLFDLQIDIGLLWTLQLNAGLILVVLGALAYVLASLFDDSTRSYMVTGGIFALFLMANVFSGFSDQLDWLNTLSIFSLFDANAQIQGESAFRSFIWLGGLLIVAMLLSYGRFTRKDLTI